MNTEKQISDELLAKYMSGKTTPEEEAVVLDYLAESDDNLDDFQQMVVAVELHKGKEKAAVVNATWKKVVWSVSAAAAIALLVVAGIFAFHHGDENGNRLAKQNQENQTQNNETTITILDTSANVRDDLEINQNDVEGAHTPAVNEPKHYADSAKKKNYANMIYPASKLTSISEKKKSISFHWNTDAVNVKISIRTQDNQVVMEKNLGAVRYFNFPIPDEADTLQWETEFTYPDGSKIVKDGKIIRWNVGLNTGK